MNLFYVLSFLSAVISSTAYHLLSKSIPKNVSPFLGLALTYAVAMITSLCLFFLTCKTGFQKEFLHLSIFNVLMGFTVAGIEGGFLIMYRSGWEISKGPLSVNITLAVILLIIGAVFFKEELNIKKIIGIILCISSVFLMNA